MPYKKQVLNSRFFLTKSFAEHFKAGRSAKSAVKLLSGHKEEPKIMLQEYNKKNSNQNSTTNSIFGKCGIPSPALITYIQGISGTFLLPYMVVCHPANLWAMWQYVRPFSCSGVIYSYIACLAVVVARLLKSCLVNCGC